MAVVISDQLPDRSERQLDAEPDERLVGLAQTGNEAAFAAIVRRYGPELLSQARRLTSDGRGEDAVQQAFLNAFTALRAGGEVRHLRGWLHQILRNVVTKAWLPPDAPLAVELADVHSLEETVQRRAQAHATLVQLSALPERQRDALVGTAVHGLPRAHVAQAMGLSEGAVRQLVHRARRRLRQAATAVLPLPLAKLLGAARSGAAAAPDAAIGATTAASGGLALKVGTLVASGVVATGLALTHTFPGHHHHAGSPTRTRHQAARTGAARRLTEAPAVRAAASVAVPASLIVAPDRVSAGHAGGSGRPARRHGSGSGRGGPGPGRGHDGGRGHDSGARGDQGSSHSGRGGDGGARGSTGDEGGGSGSGSTSGSGHSGSDSGATSSPGGGAGHDHSGSVGGGGSGDAFSLSSTGADGARVGTDTSSGGSAGGSDGSSGSGARGGSDGSGGGTDGSGGGADGSGTSGGSTTSPQTVTQPSSGGGTTSGSDGGHKDSATSRDLSGSLDSSSS
jgi:RNA polymerase sigma factor (sigma-70 family)